MKLHTHGREYLHPVAAEGWDLQPESVPASEDKTPSLEEGACGNPWGSRDVYEKKQLSEESRGQSWTHIKLKPLNTGKLKKIIVGYVEAKSGQGKMKGLPTMFLKINEIQN